MAKKKHISAVISLKDNMSATLRGIKREQKSFQREVRQTKKAMDSAFKKKMKARLDATSAHKSIQKLRKDLAPLRKKLVTAVVLKDNATARIKKIKSTMSSVGKTIAKPAVNLKDKASASIGKLGGKLAMLAKGFAIPVALAMGGAGVALKGGMELEQQQISMRHFMGVGNKGKSDKELDDMSSKYLSDLRNNANATPFETGEVIKAGTRALQISGGSTKDAMKLVTLAEDMAALNPGKSVSDAMEALADMNMGEYARLTDFGVKATKEGGDTPKGVQKQLEEMYAGGAGKLSTSGAGLMSTITGKIKSVVADTGIAMLEPLKPVMTDIIGLIDQAQPAMELFATSIGSGLGNAISFVQGLMPTLAPLFGTAFETISTVVSEAIPIISELITSLAPVFEGLLPVAQAVFEGIGSVVQFVAPVINDLIQLLKPTFENVGNALSSLGSIFSSVFDGIMSVVQSAYDFVKPLIDGIGSALSGVSGAISSGLGWVADKLNVGKKGKKGKKKNATGTRYFSGGMTLVGEHGPEIVELPKGSKVNTNRESKAMVSSSGGNNITININGTNLSPDDIVNGLIPKLKFALANL